MAKKRVGKFPKAFRQMAVDRLNHCENIVELAKELGISRRLFYGWREKLEPRDRRGKPPANAPESGQPTQAGVGREGLGDGFFQRCLATSRGATALR